LSDNGYGYYDASTGAVGGKNQAQDWYVILQPITPATKYQEDGYATIWNNIGQGGAQGIGFQNTVRLADYIDNGAGLQWSNISLAASQCTTISDWLSFGARPVNPAAPTHPPSEVPEADTLLLLGGGIGGLATWLGWQWRRRSHNPGRK
jgi:hypothetical protein